VARDFARQLRKTMTDAERWLWYELRAKRFDARKFRRQATISNYIVDFVCFESKLIVELDGGAHAAQVDRDGDPYGLAQLSRISRSEVLEQSDF